MPAIDSAYGQYTYQLRSLRIPLKHTQYDGLMTVAAGFVAQDGILLCSDTEYSGGTKIYDQKILIYPFSFCTITFAIAGHEANAKMVIRDCVADLGAMKGRRSRKEIETVIRKAVRSIYDDYVAGAPNDHERSIARFDLLIALCMPKQKPVLFESNERSIGEVTHFTCRGSGAWIGDYIVGQAYHPFTSIKSVVVVAIQLLAAAKRHYEGVSGPSQFFCAIGDNISAVMGRDFDAAEEHILKYERAAGALLLDVGNLKIGGPALKGQIQNFEREVMRIHDQWSKASSYRIFLDKLTHPSNPTIS